MAASIGRPRFRHAFSLVALTVALGGCASFSPDGGVGTAQFLALSELDKDAVKITGEAEAISARARVETLLKGAVSADAAVQIALLNNRGLQASYNDLGLAEAQMVAASLPPNPRFSVSRLTGRLETEIERAVVGSLFALVTLPARARSRLRPSAARSSRRLRPPSSLPPTRAGNSTAPSPPTSRPAICSRRSRPPRRPPS